MQESDTRERNKLHQQFAQDLEQEYQMFTTNVSNEPHPSFSAEQAFAPEVVPGTYIFPATKIMLPGSAQTAVLLCNAPGSGTQQAEEK